jgi:hypothetical protein
MHRIASVLTRLNAVAGVQSSSALLANDGKRMIQIKIRPGAKVTQVLEEVRKTLRAEVQKETPVQVEGKSAEAFGPKQDWLTISQLNELAMEESSSPQFDMGYLFLALLVLIALCAFLLWSLRRRRSEQQQTEVRFG